MTDYLNENYKIDEILDIKLKDYKYLTDLQYQFIKTLK